MIFDLILLILGLFIIVNLVGSLFERVFGDESAADSAGGHYFSDPLYEARMDSRALKTLTPNQQEVYFQAKEYSKLNGYSKGDLPVWMVNSIEEKGVSAWEWVNDEESQDNDDHDDTISVQFLNKSDVIFKLKNNVDEINDVKPTFSIKSNNPVPNHAKTLSQDTYYIEYKIFNMPPDSQEKLVLSLGLSTSPYPNFVLPGRMPFSVSYDSNGSRRFNEPFGKEEYDYTNPYSNPNPFATLYPPDEQANSNTPVAPTPLQQQQQDADQLQQQQKKIKSNIQSFDPMIQTKKANCLFPKLEQGDVIGVGVRILTKSIFFTRNGKKISESRLGGHICFPEDAIIYPTIGVSYLKVLSPDDSQVRVSCNFGQAGYVFIEANVKKWGLGNLIGNQPPPPVYERWNKDVLLDTTENERPPQFYQDEIEEQEEEQAEEHETNNDVDVVNFDFNMSNEEINLGDAINHLNPVSETNSSHSGITLDTLCLPNYENLVEEDIKDAMGESMV